MSQLPFEWSIHWYDLAKIVVSYVLAFPVGWEREKDDYSAGVRTFPLVATAACIYTLAPAGQPGAAASDIVRLAVGVMTGIGFLGAGVILRQGPHVHGTATAASIWNMGALGVAVACGRLDLALVMSLANYLTLKALRSFKRPDEETRGSDVQQP
jgi:putative Mg2+ transporter-C (MgtC) family protein